MTDIALFRTDQSLHEGSNKDKQYVGFAAANGIKSLIMADRCSLASAISFYKQCKEYSIEPIMGSLLSVYDPQKVYSAQSSRNGQFYELLYSYLSALTGHDIDEDYIKSHYAIIEKTFVSPLHKTATSAVKALSTRQKESNLINIAILGALGFETARMHLVAQSAQYGYNGAAAKKKLAAYPRHTMLGHTDLDESSCVNYFAFYIAATELASGDRPLELSSLRTLAKDILEGNHKHSSFVSAIASSFNEWQKATIAAGAKKKTFGLFDSSFMTYMEHVSKSHIKLFKATTKVDSVGSFVDAAIADTGMFESQLSFAAPQVLKSASGQLISYASSKLAGFNISKIGVEGIKSILIEDLLLSKASAVFDFTAIAAEIYMMDMLERSAGSMKPFPIDNEDDELESTLSEVCIHVIYPKLLDAAATYKQKNEGCFSDITLFANTQDGYLNVKRLISLSFMEGQTEELIETKNNKRKVNSFPKIPVERLKEFSSGVVAIVGLNNDEVDKAFRYGNSVDDALAYYESIFGKENVLVGVQKSTTEQDGAYLQSLEHNRNAALIGAAKRRGLIAFALNNAYFLDKSDYEVMDTKAAMLLDQYVSSPSRVKSYNHGHYIKTPEEMSQAFSEMPIALSNTSKLNDYLGIGSHLDITLDEPVLPQFPIPEGYNETSYMMHLAEVGLWEKFDYRILTDYRVESAELLSEEQKLEVEELRAVYQSRLEFETNVIGTMGFSGYFLIVADFIVWGKSNGVPIGPGRGSGAGSIVAYGLNITDIDPIKYGLLFERFLNPDRVSMPDFDVDFGAGFHPETGEPVNRDSVIAYVQNKYNNPDSLFPSVGQIATHSLVAAKGGIKKLAKTRFVLPAFSDTLTKLFPDAPEVKIADCLEIPEVSYRKDREREVHELMELTARMEGLKTSSGIHAGGVVIAPAEMVDFTPFQIDVRDPSKIIAQFDKSYVEYAGLVKFDFLGLANLTTIEYARKYIRKCRGINVDMSRIDYTDTDTFDLLRTGNSHGVFQVESEGMRKLLRRISCDNMEDLSALLALYRPGPLQSGMVDNFIDRKHGREDIAFPDAKHQHKCLEPILAPTYGIILYQEQVMQCAQAMAGYTLGGADLLRRAMGKKQPEEMAKQREVFSEGSESNKIDSELAMRIFDLIEKFAGYGFNKSHSMAYAHVTFQTAFLKTHYTCEYMSALLTDQSTDPEKLKATLVDCKRNGITILPPDINRSDTEFLPEGDSTIRYGLHAIKGVGEDKLKYILDERLKNGAFTSVEDMRRRCGSTFDKKVAEGLLFAGALDSLQSHIEIPEGALRKESELSTKDRTNPKLEGLKQDFHQKKHDLDSIIRQGRDLREMIVSLMVYYGERYGLSMPHHDLSDNNSMLEVAQFLIAKLPSMIDSGANDFGVNEDIKNLTSALDKRKELRFKYQEKIDAYNVALQKYDESKDLLLSAEALKDEHGERLATFDKRAFLLADIGVFVGTLKMADLAKQEKVDKALNSLSYDSIDRLNDSYRLKQEMDYLTYYVSGHPFDINNLRHKLAQSFGNTPISQLTYPNTDGLEEDERKKIERETAPSKVAGVIVSMRQTKVRKESSANFGKDMAFLTIDDSVGEMSVMIPPEMFEKIKAELFIGAPFALEGVVLRDSYADNGSLTVIPWVVYDVNNPETAIFENRPRNIYNKGKRG
ncbi:DNA polymerase III subunit alpha [Vibrio coralliirubri]|uniref:DNA polymerase III subunit alpha n=1 Tax=Vibrio coralliirubri TaxID=1516159 RepID=UPI0022833FDC|nr:DNA polymerase III subunit alpha [Vibrio coralliirubri]MCY9866103.1 DNA polymerase III subunit alpha [Vibrio coralliirubri]